VTGQTTAEQPARASAGDATTADDLLQKTFYRFLRSNPTLVDEDHLRRYVYRTATNLVFDDAKLNFLKARDAGRRT